ncbi:DUF6894 family protein [Lichenihabitans sp. PAMC28606]|uniref:DUF6894 family protein n=1 Tax=Lichenihabitans sp. PAMC28606 TaxID=2880932 RepID=UPI0039B676FF
MIGRCALPCYHFNVYGGSAIRDIEGSLLSSNECAQSELLQYAADLLARESMDLYPDAEWKIEVTDCLRNLLFRISINLSVFVVVDSKQHIEN